MRRLETLETRAAKFKERQKLERHSRRVAAGKLSGAASATKYYSESVSTAKLAGAASASKHHSRNIDIAAVYWHEIQRPGIPFRAFQNVKL